MTSYRHAEGCVAVFNAILTTSVTRQYWNIFLMKDRILFVFDQELYKALVLRLVQESSRSQLETVPDLAELEQSNPNNFSIDLENVLSICIKEGGIFLRPTLSVVTKNQEKLDYILYTQTRKERFAWLNGIPLLDGRLKIRVQRRH